MCNPSSNIFDITLIQKGKVFLAPDTLVPTGQALAEEGLANVDCDESGVPEAYVVASSLQLASRSDAPEDDGSGKKLWTTGDFAYHKL